MPLARMIRTELTIKNNRRAILKTTTITHRACVTLTTMLQRHHRLHLPRHLLQNKVSSLRRTTAVNRISSLMIKLSMIITKMSITIILGNRHLTTNTHVRTRSSILMTSRVNRNNIRRQRMSVTSIISSPIFRSISRRPTMLLQARQTTNRNNPNLHMRSATIITTTPPLLFNRKRRFFNRPLSSQSRLRMLHTRLFNRRTMSLRQIININNIRHNRHIPFSTNFSRAIRSNSRPIRHNLSTLITTMHIIRLTKAISQSPSRRIIINRRTHPNIVSRNHINLSHIRSNLAQPAILTLRLRTTNRRISARRHKLATLRHRNSLLLVKVDNRRLFSMTERSLIIRTRQQTKMRLLLKRRRTMVTVRVTSNTTKLNRRLRGTSNNQRIYLLETLGLHPAKIATVPLHK